MNARPSGRCADGPKRCAAPSVRRAAMATVFGLGAAATWMSIAQAAEFSLFQRVNETQGFAGVSFVVALVLISTVTSLLHLAGRKQWTTRETALTKELTDLRAALERANLFLSAESQIVVAWGAAEDEPAIEGDLSLVTGTPVARRVLGFGSWLAPGPAQEFERCVEKLRSRGEAFRLAFTSLSGRHLEAEGRAVGGRAVMRIRDVSGDRLELTRLRERHARVLTELDSLRTLLDATPQAVWMRGPDGALTWVNAAYAKAVEAADPQDAVIRKIELLDQSSRDAAATTRQSANVWRSRVTAVVAGERHSLAVVDLPASAGSVGQATDLSELEQIRADLSRQMDAHTRTLDQLPTAVAIFDRSKRLVFHNSAYRELWSLDSSFLDQRPLDSEVLDRLRAARRLPEQADFRAWKSGLLSAYQSLETIEQSWYLPDGRTLRAVINPNPQGGVTYLFDDVTERFHLESRYNALIRVQGETLDSLKEGVAVFGSDGRLKLFNPAFGNLWKIAEGDLADQPHIDRVVSFCMSLHADASTWTDLRSLVSGLPDARTGFERRLVRADDSVVDCAAAPLPDGATLLTFSDITASVNEERTLTERNQALLEAEKLRNDFVHHVSYELRSPLTNIIGFIQLLADGSVGRLNDKQLEYSSYILKSSAALLAIINDILDLATIDTDAMELSIDDVDIRPMIDSAADGLQDRLADAALHLQVVALDDIGSFKADSKRIRQILYNLLSNAIGFSAPGQTITLAALRRDGSVVFKVTDQGRGIPLDVLERVFDRFHSHTIGSRHRGVGLGLSIVRSFVELHGGTVHIQSAPGEGTTVTCEFPANGVADRHANVA
jgi:signal transduction histidine kinase